MIKNIKIPVILIGIGIILLVLTSIFVSRFMLNQEINVVASNNNNNVLQVNGTINKPVPSSSVVESVSTKAEMPFKTGILYTGTQGNEGIEIKVVNGVTEEFNISTPSNIYTLKSVKNKTNVGIALGRYDSNNKLVGTYALLGNNGTWAGVYTTNNNVVCNVDIK